MATYKHDHTHLTNPEPEKIAEFCTKVMGAKFISKRGISGRKVIDLNLGGIPLRVSDATGADASWKGARFGLHHLGLEVNNLDEALAELKANGADIVTDIAHPLPGVRTAFIKSPDNALFELIEKSGS